MKKIHGDTKNRVLGLCMLIATLFWSAVAKADVVLDWNMIAGEHSSGLPTTSSDARVYGGIHFRTDQVAGERLGDAAGKAVYKNNLSLMHDKD
jgi:hypothetical protein